MDTTLRRARDIILGADERVTESIKWRTPTFGYRSNVASFNPSKRLVSILFHRGAEIPQPSTTCCEHSSSSSMRPRS
ncbi:MAG TPA: DUF1801 domain-containing protein [Actinophytocola sp.]|jgi:hypothetical protein|uniref:DUF1801 domain-containing protein n=1 Tax=Actinophytocola sp. TaxID=1872138 RepID=UPI002F923319